MLIAAPVSAQTYAYQPFAFPICTAGAEFYDISALACFACPQGQIPNAAGTGNAPPSAAESGAESCAVDRGCDCAALSDSPDANNSFEDIIRAVDLMKDIVKNKRYRDPAFGDRNDVT